MLPAQAVAVLVAVMVLAGAAGLTAALQLPGSEAAPVTPSQFLLPAMAVVVAAAVSLQVVGWRLPVAPPAPVAVGVFRARYRHRRARPRARPARPPFPR